VTRYFVIIDKRDFKKLKISLADQKNYSNQKFWAFSQKDKEKFVKIRKGDLIYFGKAGFASWQFAFKVLKKENNSNFVTSIWGKDLRSKNATLVLHFEAKNYLKSKERLPYIRKISSYRPGIYKIIEKIVSNKPEPEHKLSETLRGVPKKKLVSVKRTERDSKKVKNLKKSYDDKCQVCSQRIEIGDKRYYSEVHHLRPIGSEGGEDDLKNMMVVCPTHHKAFDYCAIRISLDKKHIIDRYDKIIGKLYLKKKHQLSSESINYQFYRKLK